MVEPYHSKQVVRLYWMEILIPVVPKPFVVMLNITSTVAVVEQVARSTSKPSPLLDRVMQRPTVEMVYIDIVIKTITIIIQVVEVVGVLLCNAQTQIHRPIPLQVC